MQSSTTLTFQHVPRSPILESDARELGARLQRIDNGIRGCHFTFDGSPDGTAGAPRYAVRIHLSLPGAQIHADSVQRSGAGHGDAHAALREAYGNARRQLEELKRARAQAATGAGRVLP